MSQKKTPEKTPEELDEEDLREIESKMKEVLDLMDARHDRERTDEQLEMARTRQLENAGNLQPVFHITSSHHVPTTMHTKSMLDLAEQLKLRIKLGKYAKNLDDSLQRLSVRLVDVLERMHSRSRY